MSVSAPPKQTLPLVQPGVQSDYFIKTKFLGGISIEKCMAFCPYRIDGWLPGAGKILLARAPVIYLMIAILGFAWAVAVVMG